MAPTITMAMTIAAQKRRDSMTDAQREADQAAVIEEHEEKNKKRGMFAPGSSFSSGGRVQRIVSKIGEFLNGTGFQTTIYFVFVIVFQSLSQTMRNPSEYLVDKHVMDRIVENRARRTPPRLAAPRARVPPRRPARALAPRARRL